MEAALGTHRSLFLPSAGVLQQHFGGPEPFLHRTTPASSVRLLLGFGTGHIRGLWSKSGHKSSVWHQCGAAEGSAGSNRSRLVVAELGSISDGEMRLESCPESSGWVNEQLQVPEGTERTATTVTFRASESPLGEELCEASPGSNAACLDPLGHQNPNSHLDSGCQNPSLDLREASPAADATSDSPSSFNGVPALEDEASVRRPSKPVYIVDIMPICYRGRGRGKLDPKACLEWMEALIGIAGDSPIVGVLDGENGNAWRRELYPDYKSGRKLFHPFPTIGHRRNRHRVHIDPFVNMPMLEPLFRLLNVPIVKVPHAEADDVIATLAQQAVDMGHRVNIVSPDTDLRQLLSGRISIWAPRAELMRQFNFFDGRKFEERVGYPPEKFVLLRCLLGDQSDAIRGLPYYVPEFGRNSALKLIEKFGSVAELLDAARMRTIGRPYMQEAVLEYSQVLELNERLITLKRDVEGVALDPAWLRPRDRSTEREAYNACAAGLRAMKRAGRTVLVRPTPDADRKLSGVPAPPKEPRPPKDRAPRWPPGFQDYKGLLQTACVRAECPTPEYSLETEGLVHEPLHSATVLVGGLAVKGPYEKLKKSAEHAAARAAWEALLQDQNGTEDWTLEQKGEAVQRALHERIHGDTVIRLLEGQLQTH